MTDEKRAELRRVIGDVVRSAPLPGTTDKYQEIITPPLTHAQQLALSVLLGEPDTVIQSALADMLLDMGHEYAMAVAERARAEEREKPAHLSPGSAVTAYGMSGHVIDMNINPRIDGRTECEIRVVLMTGREEIGEWVPARSDSTE